jgi:hypothetical protein
MNRFLCLLGGALSCITLTAAVSASLPHWAAQAGLDLWNTEESERWLKRENDRSDELDRRASLLIHHVEMKERITSDLVEGRLTLIEAARAFLPLQRHAEKELGARAPGMLVDLPEEERICRMLIAWIETRFRLEPSPRSVIVSQLKNELEEQLLAGSLHLTD